jgi:hypothetical protein
MSALEYVTVAIAAAAMLTRIALFLPRPPRMAAK